MGCNCGGKGNVQYQVRFTNGTSQTYSTIAEAQAAIAKSGGSKSGATIKAVPK